MKQLSSLYNPMLVWIWANTNCDLWPGPPLHLLHCVAHLKYLSVSSNAESHWATHAGNIILEHVPHVLHVLSAHYHHSDHPDHPESNSSWDSLAHPESHWSGDSLAQPKSCWSDGTFTITCFDLYHLCVYKHSILHSYVHCIDPNSLRNISTIHHATWFIFW